jgi:hypothetical protein
VQTDSGREIQRRPGNPMLRYAGGGDRLIDDAASALSTSTQEKLQS